MIKPSKPKAKHDMFKITKPKGRQLCRWRKHRVPKTSITDMDRPATTQRSTMIELALSSDSSELQPRKFLEFSTNLDSIGERSTWKKLDPFPAEITVKWKGFPVSFLISFCWNIMGYRIHKDKHLIQISWSSSLIEARAPTYKTCSFTASIPCTRQPIIWIWNHLNMGVK